MESVCRSIKSLDVLWVFPAIVFLGCSSGNTSGTMTNAITPTPSGMQTGTGGRAASTGGAGGASGSPGTGGMVATAGKGGTGGNPMTTLDASSLGGGGTPAPMPDAGPPQPPPDAGPTGPTPPAPFPCPASPTLAAGASMANVSITFGGSMRSYDVHVGTKVDPKKPTAIMLSYHGLTNSPSIQASWGAMNPVADSEGFIVAYPAGISASFNAGSCCGSAASMMLDDVGFGEAIVKDIATKLCVDSTRVYVTGFSNGGYMSNKIACDATDFFAGAAPTEGALGMPPADCKPKRAIAVIGAHSQGDTVVSAANGKAAIDNFVAIDHCGSPPKDAMEGGAMCSTWSGCDSGVEIKWCTWAGGTHLPPTGSAPVIWKFLSQFHL